MNAEHIRSSSLGLVYVRFENWFQIDGALSQLRDALPDYRMGWNQNKSSPEIWFVRYDAKRIAKREQEQIATACRQFGGMA